MLARIKWLTYLSLDAPLVTVAWQALLARSYHAELHWHQRAIVFSSVWLGYAADRWFDNLKTEKPRSEQHLFFSRHERPFLAAWFIALAGTVTLALANLGSVELYRGFVLMAASIAYSLFAQGGRKLPGYPLIKSLLTGLLIMASALLFLPIEKATLLTELSIWCLFSSNCLFIRSWTRSREPWSATLGYALSSASGILAAFALWQQFEPIAAATLLSLAALLALQSQRRRLPNETLRTAADLCLLSPLLLLALR